MSFSDVVAARRDALASACAQCKAGIRGPNWLYTDDDYLWIGISEGRVVVKFLDVNATLADLWATMCQALAKPGTFRDNSRKEGDPHITFEVA